MNNQNFTKTLNVSIKHFVSRFEANNLKNENWYLSLRKNIFRNSLFGICAPSRIKGFEQWKEYNPKRDYFE